MQQSTDAPLAIGRVVTQLGVSRRKLERRFHSALGITPLESDRLIRIEPAKHLLRVFRAVEGTTPQTLRRAKSSAR